MPRVETVCKVKDLPPDSMQRFEVGGRAVLLINLGGEMHAVGAECIHGNASLDEGGIEGGEIVCPLHMGRFAIKTGKATGRPPILPLPRYKVWIRGEDVLVDAGEALL